MIQLTDEQKRNFRDPILAGQNVLCEAPPGCGKTSTKIATFMALPANKQGQVISLVYNRHSKDDEITKFPTSASDQIKTIDSWAWKTVASHYRKGYRDWKFDSYKDRRMAEHFAKEYHHSDQFSVAQLQQIDDLRKIYQIVQSQLVDENDWQTIVRMLPKYGIFVEDDNHANFIRQGIPALVEWTTKGNKAMSKNPYFLNGYTFGELPWLVWYNRITPPPLSIVLADEIQDWTEAQWYVIKQALGRNGQFGGLGDPRQALYQFRGVRSDQFGRIANDLQCPVTSLSVTFRCPKVAIPRLQRYIPGLKAHENNPEGAIIPVTKNDCLTVLKIGDVCLFLTNAHAIAMAQFLLRHRIPATVKGQDIGEDLINLLDKLTEQPNFVFYHPEPDHRQLPDFVDQWESNQIAKIQRLNRDGDALIEYVSQSAESLRTLYGECIADGITDIGDFRASIRNLFSSDQDAGIYGKYVVCMTAHKAKGLEWDNVLVSDSELRSWRGKSQEEKDQHFNSLLVMESRYKQILYLLVEEKVDCQPLL